MKTTIRGMLVAGAILVPVITVAGPIDYESFSGTLINFDDLAGSPMLGAGEVLSNQYADLGVTFRVPNYNAYASTSVSDISGLNSDPNMIWVDQGGGGSANAIGMIIDFANPVSELGMLYLLSTTSTFSIAAYNGDTLLETQTTDELPPEIQYPEGYLAITNSNITRAVVYSTSHFTPIPDIFGTNWNFSIDNLKFKAASVAVAVPEPGTGLLLCGGLLGLLMTRRRKAA